MTTIENEMLNETIFECPDLVKFSKVIDCARAPNEYKALLLIKINKEKTKALQFYTADHMIYEEEYYEKLVEYLKSRTFGLHRVTNEE